MYGWICNAISIEYIDILKLKCLFLVDRRRQDRSAYEVRRRRVDRAFLISVCVATPFL